MGQEVTNQPEKENEKMDFCNFFAGVLRL